MLVLGAGRGLQPSALNVPLDVRMQPQVRTRWFRLDLRVALMDSEFAETALVDARFQPSRLADRRWTD